MTLTQNESEVTEGEAREKVVMTREERIEMLMRTKNPMEIVEKNEKKFKIMAESMIEQSSYLLKQQTDEELLKQSAKNRRYMTYQAYKEINNQLPRDSEMTFGIPICIQVHGDFVYIGMS